MKKISKLTKKQKALIPGYLEKFRSISLSTNRIDREKAKKDVCEFYKACGKNEPKLFLFMDSPFAAQIACNLIINNKINLTGQLRDQLGEELGDQLWDQLWDQLCSQLRGPALGQLCSQLRDQLRDQLGDQLRDQLRDQKLQWETVFFSTTDSYFCSFYSFIKNELFPNELTPMWDAYEKLNENVFWFIPYNNAVIFSEKPIFHHWKNERLHCENGPAISFADNYSLYALDGIRVPEWVVTTPVNEMDPKKILDIVGADQKRVAIKKYGAQNMVKALGGKIIDNKTYDVGGTYELIEVDWTGKRIYLKMTNPSLKGVHIEPVHPDCKTVDQALGFREQEYFGDSWQKKGFNYESPKIYT